MPCNAVVYLPATVQQLNTTAIFTSPEATKLTLEMLKATLAATLGAPAYHVEDWGTNITAYIPDGVIRIWRDGQVNIRLYAGDSQSRDRHRSHRGCHQGHARQPDADPHGPSHRRHRPSDRYPVRRQQPGPVCEHLTPVPRGGRRIP